jgi:hypothetical protein
LESQLGFCFGIDGFIDCFDSLISQKNLCFMTFVIKKLKA